MYSLFWMVRVVLLCAFGLFLLAMSVRFPVLIGC